jgi:site-specific recombinase XerD
MNEIEMIGPWIRRFLLEYLVKERNLAPNTRASYRDTLILLLPFIAKSIKKTVDRLSIDDISPDLIRSFLLYLEEDRKCCVATRNQRLAAIHALAGFIGVHSPQHLDWCVKIRGIPLKKTPKPVMCYLEKSEMDAILNAPNRKTAQGARDYALLLFLYNTGARASETAQLTIGDITIEGSAPSVKITGKAGKVRYCPLWALTCSVLKSLVYGRVLEDRVFLNRLAEPITRFGIYGLVKRYAAKASEEEDSLRKKDVSPHTIRHTTAVFLLRAGVDINTIRAWLGHVSLDTTHIYAEVDLEMKTKALAHCEIMAPSPVSKQWHEKGIINFLKTL